MEAKTKKTSREWLARAQHCAQMAGCCRWASPRDAKQWDEAAQACLRAAEREAKREVLHG